MATSAKAKAIGKYDEALAAGQQINALTSLGLVRSFRGQREYLLVCECGQIKWMSGSMVVREKCISCGCVSAEMSARRCAARATHGLANSSLYVIWSGMMARCYSPTSPRFDHYGKRGITVCPRWHDLAAFCEDMIPSYTIGRTLDRIDNDQGYFPANVRWATQKQQQRHRRNNRLITYKGITQCLSKWAESVGISTNLLGQRLVRDNLPMERALSPGRLR